MDPLLLVTFSSIFSMSVVPLFSQILLPITRLPCRLMHSPLGFQLLFALDFCWDYGEEAADYDLKLGLVLIWCWVFLRTTRSSIWIRVVLSLELVQRCRIVQGVELFDWFELFG
ncbi:hypothetical protein Droror1_Dr00005768 [Drosera rotundifolia]